MTNNDKKEWTTPKLRVFVRSKAEERVLAGCKLTPLVSGPKPQYNLCAKFLYDPCPLYCFDTNES
jgi:hypothetical protein